MKPRAIFPAAARPRRSRGPRRTMRPIRLTRPPDEFLDETMVRIGR